MPRITVKNAAVTEKTLPNGKIMRRQMCALELGNGYSLPFSVGLGQRPAYPVGEYDIDPQSFALNQYGDITLGRFVDLIEVGAKAAKAA